MDPKPRNKILPQQSQLWPGYRKKCLAKNVLSSTSCHSIIRENKAQARPTNSVRPSQLIEDHEAGVNCIKHRFAFPDLWFFVLKYARYIAELLTYFESIERTLSHLYRLISKNFATCIPSQIPPPLHITTSSNQWSHQHSLKFGKICSNWNSVS